MQAMSNPRDFDTVKRSEVGQRSIESTPGSVEQSLEVARFDSAGVLTGQEKIAYFVAAFMMLAPLAMAACGAHFDA